MKKRDGFVSNSSACSFTCPVCESEYQHTESDDGKKYTVCSDCGSSLAKEHLKLERIDSHD